MMQDDSVTMESGCAMCCVATTTSDVAYLSTVVPKTIAVLSTLVPRVLLRATIEDVVAAIDEARERLTENGGKGRPRQGTWLAQRER